MKYFILLLATLATPCYGVNPPSYNPNLRPALEGLANARHLDRLCNGASGYDWTPPVIDLRENSGLSTSSRRELHHYYHAAYSDSQRRYTHCDDSARSALRAFTKQATDSINEIYRKK